MNTQQQQSESQTAAAAKQKPELDVLISDSEIDMSLGLMDCAISKLKYVIKQYKEEANNETKIYSQIATLINAESLRQLNQNNISAALDILVFCRDTVMDDEDLVSKSEEMKMLQGLTLCNIGVCLRRNGKLSSSLDALVEAQQITQKISDKRHLGNILLNLSVLNSQIGLHDKALLFAKKALQFDGWEEGSMQNIHGKDEQCFTHGTDEIVVQNIGIGKRFKEQSVAVSVLGLRTAAVESDILGNHVQARKYFEAAFETAQNNLGENHPVTMVCQEELDCFINSRRNHNPSEEQQIIENSNSKLFGTPRSYDSFREKVLRFQPNNHDDVVVVAGDDKLRLNINTSNEQDLAELNQIENRQERQFSNPRSSNMLRSLPAKHVILSHKSDDKHDSESLTPKQQSAAQIIQNKYLSKDNDDDDDCGNQVVPSTVIAKPSVVDRPTPTLVPTELQVIINLIILMIKLMPYFEQNNEENQSSQYKYSADTENNKNHAISQQVNQINADAEQVLTNQKQLQTEFTQICMQPDVYVPILEMINNNNNNHKKRNPKLGNLVLSLNKDWSISKVSFFEKEDSDLQQGGEIRQGKSSNLLLINGKQQQQQQRSQGIDHYLELVNFQDVPEDEFEQMIMAIFQEIAPMLGIDTYEKYLILTDHQEQTQHNHNHSNSAVVVQNKQGEILMEPISWELLNKELYRMNIEPKNLSVTRITLEYVNQPDKHCIEEENEGNENEEKDNTFKRLMNDSSSDQIQPKPEFTQVQKKSNPNIDDVPIDISNDIQDPKPLLMTLQSVERFIDSLSPDEANKLRSSQISTKKKQSKQYTPPSTEKVVPIYRRSNVEFSNSKSGIKDPSLIVSSSSQIINSSNNRSVPIFVKHPKNKANSAKKQQSRSSIDQNPVNESSLQHISSKECIEDLLEKKPSVFFSNQDNSDRHIDHMNSDQINTPTAAVAVRNQQHQHQQQKQQHDQQRKSSLKNMKPPPPVVATNKQEKSTSKLNSSTNNQNNTPPQFVSIIFHDNQPNVLVDDIPNRDCLQNQEQQQQSDNNNNILMDSCSRCKKPISKNNSRQSPQNQSIIVGNDFLPTIQTEINQGDECDHKEADVRNCDKKIRKINDSVIVPHLDPQQARSNQKPPSTYTQQYYANLSEGDPANMPRLLSANKSVLLGEYQAFKGEIPQQNQYQTQPFNSSSILFSNHIDGDDHEQFHQPKGDFNSIIDGIMAISQQEQQYQYTPSKMQHLINNPKSMVNPQLMGNKSQQDPDLIGQILPKQYQQQQQQYLNDPNVNSNAQQPGYSHPLIPQQQLNQFLVNQSKELLPPQLLPLQQIPIQTNLSHPRDNGVRKQQPYPQVSSPKPIPPLENQDSAAAVSDVRRYDSPVIGVVPSGEVEQKEERIQDWGEQIQIGQPTYMVNKSLPRFFMQEVKVRRYARSPTPQQYPHQA